MPRDIFASEEEAARWLDERLDKLAENVEEAAELRRLINEGRREVLVDIDANPHRFAQDANDRLRRYSAQIHAQTARRLEREGFQSAALQQTALELLGRDVNHGVRILRALAEVLRRRSERLSEEGTQLFEEGREAFLDAVEAIGVALREAERVWSSRGPGRDARSRLPWRRRRAEKLLPMDDPTYRGAATEAVTRNLNALQDALRKVGRGSLLLSASKYHGDVVNQLGALIQAGENLRDRARILALQARQRLEELRRRQDVHVHSADSTLLDDETLDAILARLDVDATAFLLRGDVGADALARQSAEEIDASIRAWVEAQLGGLAAPSLADVLGDIAGDPRTVRRQLLRFFAAGQPLMHFNDDLPLTFEGGMRAQSAILIEATDSSLHASFDETCHQMGLPDPQITTLTPDQDGHLEVRVLQFAAGVPFFAQVDRLMPLIALRDEVLVFERHDALGAAIDPSLLRDTPDLPDLPDVIPDAIRRAFEQEHRMGRSLAPTPPDFKEVVLPPESEDEDEGAA